LRLKKRRRRSKKKKKRGEEKVDVPVVEFRSRLWGKSR
jgi:hypothetical protein